MYYEYDGNIPQEKITSKMIELAEKIGYHYNDISWLKRAFYTEIKFDTNEEKYANSPMGTLGDRVLSMIITEELFDENKSSEEITKDKIEKESNTAWLQISNEWELYRFAYNNNNFYNDAPADNRLPNSKHTRYFEALIAAIYKDLGYEACRDIYKKLSKMRKDGAVE